MTADSNKPTKVLNDGFVRLIDFMGEDESIAQAARVSYAKGTKKVSEDRDLIRFLMRHEHYSPFACCQVKLHLRVPLFIIGQMHRHDRFHWSMMSARYSVMPDEKWAPVLPEDIRGQGQGNKQVGNGKLDVEAEEDAFIAIESANENAQMNYQELLNLGVCREQARAVLPVGQYTEGFVTANLGDWMLFLKQRLDPHSQKEIRVYAEAIEQILNQLFPVCMEAFRDYQLNRVVLSAAEAKAIHYWLDRSYFNNHEFVPTPEDEDGPDYDGVNFANAKRDTIVQLLGLSGIINKRETEEFIAKFKMD